MRSGQGFTAGLGYRRSDLWAERLGYRATGRATLQRAYLFDFNLDFQGLKTERTAVSGTEMRAPATSISTGLETTVPRKTTPAFRMTT